MDKTAWHFTGPTLRDGRPIPAIGEWLEHEGPVEICRSGLHASYHPFDALRYAPGPLLHFVAVSGVEDDGDKLVCRRRKILISHDFTKSLRRFACDQALSVLPGVVPVTVRDYLQDPTDDKRVPCLFHSANLLAFWGSMLDHVKARTVLSAVRQNPCEAAYFAAYDACWVHDNYDARCAARDDVRAEFQSIVCERFGLY